MSSYNEIEFKDATLYIYEDRYEVRKNKKGFFNFLLGYCTSREGAISLIIAAVLIFVIYFIFSFIFSSTLPLKSFLLIPILANLPFSVLLYNKYQKDVVIPKLNFEEISFNKKNKLIIHYLNNARDVHLIKEIAFPKEENKKREILNKLKEFKLLYRSYKLPLL